MESGQRRKSSTAALATIALAALLLLAPASASALSAGMRISNLGSEPLKLTAVTTQGPAPVFEESDNAPLRPRKGTTLLPGEELHVEIARSILLGDGRRVELTFTRAPAQGKRGGTFQVFLREDGLKSCHEIVGAYPCHIDGDRILILDPPGSRNILDAKELQAQADALQRLCTDQNDCSFDAEKRFQASTPSRVLGRVVNNCLDEPTEQTIRVEEKVGKTNSVALEYSVKLSFMKIVETELVLKYKHERLDENTFSQDVKVPIKADSKAWVKGTAPVIRDEGTFELKLGNTVWVIENVYFDAPDPSRYGDYVIDSKHLSPEEHRAVCTHEVGGIVSSHASTVRTVHMGSSGANLMVGGAESNDFQGRGGHDMLRGGVGHDHLHGGGGGDSIRGGAGEDDLYGGPGDDYLTDASGPTIVHTGAAGEQGRDTVDVLDGHGDDIVFCETPRSVVFADKGDQIRGDCARVETVRPPAS
jgi:hypothetical protein